MSAVEWRESLYRERSRLEQLLATMARLGHPMRKFTWGNVSAVVFLQRVPECRLVIACLHSSQLESELIL